MSAQLMRTRPNAFASADPLDANPEEADRAWRGYIGYWGTVDVTAGVVVHLIEGGWFPNWIGQKQVRSFRFAGDQLILGAETPAWQAVLVWQRID